MSNALESRLTDLVDRWEQLRDQGGEAALEDLCGDCPELLPELRRRVAERTATAARNSTWTHETESVIGETRLPDVPPTPPTPVSITPEDFEILGELGHGGMGVVYRAFDRRRREVVALKTLRWIDPAALHMFRKEFRAAADLAHPNLVPLYEMTWDGRAWFFTMELVEGVDFLTYVRSGTGDLPESTHAGTAPSARPAPALGRPAARPTRDATEDETLLGIGLDGAQLGRLRSSLRQLVEGVNALHQAGRLHRDLKPSNVLVRRDGRLVVMDFGLAAELSEKGEHLSTDRLVRGTLAYMSPEQATGRTLTTSSDWYTVGVMMFEALTGRRPLLAGAMPGLQSLPAHPHALAAGVPDDLDALCADLLSIDPTQRPNGAEILRRLGERDPVTSAVVPAPIPASSLGTILLVGRGRHLASLRARLGEMTSGKPLVVRVHGASGAGKSVLVQRFLEELEADAGVVVLAGRCYERESVPFKALDSVVEALGNHLRRLARHEVEALLPRDVLSLARVFPALRRVEAIAMAPARGFDVPDPQELRRRAFLALRDLLARLGDRKRLVVAIDDLQWGDVDSVPALAEILRGPDAPSLLLLACHREADVGTSPFLGPFLELEAAADDSVAWHALAVEPLTEAEARVLANALLPAGTGHASDLIEAIGRESGGNPYFVGELVRAAGLEEGVTDGEGSLSLDGMLRARAARLPHAERRLLEVIAVAGRPIRETTVEQAAGLAAEERRSTLAALKVGRLARGTGPSEAERVEAYHDRVREAIVAGLSPVELRERHRALAEALEVSGEAEPEALGMHWRGAGALERAGDYFARAAARASSTLAFDRAAELYRLALELRPAIGDEARALQRSLGDALANAGRGGEAARAYLAAAPGASVAEAFDLRRLAAAQLLVSGHVDEGLANLRDVLASVGMSLPPTPFRTLLSLLYHRAKLSWRGYEFTRRDPSQVAAADLARIDVCWAAVAGLSVVDFIRGADFQARGMLLALDAGESFRVARALAMQVMHVATEGTRVHDQTERLLTRAEAIAREVGDPYALAIHDTARGTCAYLEGRWNEALRACDQAEVQFRERCTGVAWELATSRSFALWALSHLGRFDELGRRWPVLLQEARERGDLYEATNLSTYIMAMVLLSRDEPRGARQALQHVMPNWSTSGYHIQHNDAVWAATQVELYQGEPAEAWRLLGEIWPALRRSLLLRVQFIRVMMRHLRARAALALAESSPDRARLIRSAETDATSLLRERAPWAGALAGVALAGVSAIRGERDRAIARLEAAERDLESVDMAAYAAAARRRRGTLVGSARGDVLVQEADARFLALGVANPERMTATYAPGFGGLGP